MFSPLLIALLCLSVPLSPFAAAQGRVERILTSLGFIIKDNAPVQPTEWEQAQFQTLAKRIIKIKSVRPLPRQAHTFYRFNVVEEKYADSATAGKRLSRLLERPPDLSAEDGKAFPLRTGFQHERDVYIISTDVWMFEGELKRIARELEMALKRRKS